MMNFDISLDLYKIFVTIVDTGSISGAARKLFITQPAVSMAVKQLEERLGKPLFARSPRGVKPTAEGLVMYDYLCRAFGLIDAAEKKYTEMAELKKGEVRIGAGDTIMRRYLLPYIEKYLEINPAINFKITNRTTFGTVSLLKTAQVDIGFVNLPFEEDLSLEVTECVKIRDCVIGGSKYAHLCKKGITFPDFKNLNLMLLERDSNSRRAQDRFASLNGYMLSPSIELGSSDLLTDCVKINLGVAVVTKEFTDIDGVSVFEIPIKPEFPERAVGMIKLKGVGLSYAAGSFAAFTQTKL